ncbi:hypothetical protein B0H11DRAFT_1922455 [Mycena galericulata]|nr:hypothetical protein B0H11DRAFT_1922455 [Mycena galericulata]
MPNSTTQTGHEESLQDYVTAFLRDPGGNYDFDSAAFKRLLIPTFNATPIYAPSGRYLSLDTRFTEFDDTGNEIGVALLNFLRFTLLLTNGSRRFTVSRAE